MNYEKEFSQEPKAIWGFLFRARYSTDSQPERFHLFLAPWSTAMTKKWNKALPEIENFKLPSPALKVFPFLCFISFKSVSWYLKATTFPFQCYLHITFLHTCEHKDFLLLTNVLVWLDDLVSVQVSHYTTITFLIPFQTLGTKMYPEVVSTLSLKDLVIHLTQSTPSHLTKKGIGEPLTWKSTKHAHL